MFKYNISNVKSMKLFCCTKTEEKPKFIGTNAQNATLQKDLTAIFNQIYYNQPTKGYPLIQERLRTEQGILEIILILEKELCGEYQQGQNLLERVALLKHKASLL